MASFIYAYLVVGVIWAIAVQINLVVNKEANKSLSESAMRNLGEADAPADKETIKLNIFMVKVFGFFVGVTCWPLACAYQLCRSEE